MIIAYFVALGLFAFLFTREVIAPASGNTCDKRWRIYAGALNALNVVVIVLAGEVFSVWIRGNSLYNLPNSLPAAANGFVIFLAASFCAYWWHRLTHDSRFLWRAMHQLHHSPARVEALTSFYLHPLDSFMAAFINASVAFLALGATVFEAGFAFAYAAAFNLVSHADMRTPWALGFFLQRPEMHRVHHERESHRNNYGLPIWDLMFGTWRNPRANADTECGFGNEQELRVMDMLLMRDIEKSPAP